MIDTIMHTPLMYLCVYAAAACVVLAVACALVAAYIELRRQL